MSYQETEVKGAKWRLIVVAIIVTIFIFSWVTIQNDSSDHSWSERARQDVLNADFMRHSLAKDLCIMVTHRGAIAEVTCSKVEHLLVNPKPSEKD